MKGKYSTEAALALLREKARALQAAGETRCPRRGDFSEEEVVAIKAFLGPWPRALEQAGLEAYVALAPRSALGEPILL